MKKFISNVKLSKTICFALIGILFSCSFNKKTQENQNTDKFKTFDTIVPFSGFWLSENYVNTLNKTKSPSLSQSENTYSIEIPTRTLEITRMVGGLHDGAADMIVVKKNNDFQFYYKHNDTIREIAYNIQIISTEKIKIGNIVFIKVNENFLEELLFSGKYKSNQGEIVEFTINGELKGLEKYKFYSPIVDYVDEGMDIDQVILKETEKDEKTFGFKFKDDSLLIYKVKCLEYDSLNDICGKVDYGELIYRLKKLK